MRFATILGVVGRALIWTGCIVLAFVAYQLWGTGVAEARAQSSLEDEFTAALARAGDPVSTSSTTTAPEAPTAAPTTTTTTSPPPPPDDGEAAARIVIPRIGVDKIVVEGVSRSDLQRGPGHYPQTPLPGQPGNAAIAGHRTTYGAPFQRVDELDVGDEILVTTLQGSFRYEVVGTEIVTPDQVEVIEDHGDDRLTLTSCHPEYSARERIIVSALLLDPPAPPSPDADAGDLAGDQPTIPGEDGEAEDGRDDGGDGDDDEEAGVGAAGSDRDGDGDGDGPTSLEALESLDAGARRTAAPAVRWGLLSAAIWLGFAVLSRRWRRWPSYLLGAPVFAASLFVTFGAVSDLLPANF